MHLGGPQTLEVLRRLEQALEGTGPARVLVQQVAFRLTPAGDECSVESGARAHARYLASPLAVAVDFEPHQRLELREHLWVRMEAEAQARGKHIIEAPVT